jgi:excisionase family DNA binding protein
MQQDALQIAYAAVRAYAESHPRPPHVTQVQAAEMLGLSRPTVRKMVRSGQLKMNACGLIPVEEIDRALAVKAASQYPTQRD